MNFKILPGLTTNPGYDYKKKVAEINELGLTEIALFPTALNANKRKELYELLEDTGIKDIPHVHLREDMGLRELEYLKERFRTKVFNIHDEKDAHPFFDFREKIGDRGQNIYIENTQRVPSRDELGRLGGLCIDFSHWQDAILFGYPDYDIGIKKAIEIFDVGCSHVSAVGEKIIESRDLSLPDVIYQNYSKHYFDDLSELDYIKNFLYFIPRLISLELENPFSEQLKAKEYLEKIIA